MAEQLGTHQPEQHRSTEHQAERSPEHAPTKHYRAETDRQLETEQQHSAEAALTRAKQEAVSGKDQSVEKTAQAPGHGTSPLVNRELRRLMFKRTLTSVQKQLPAPARAFSKVVHNPAVDKVSSVAEKTVARPKGILVGGFVAFVGCLYTFYLAKHYGFHYNLILFVTLFAAGYIITTIIEVTAIVLKRTFHD
jgi:hypothetical protein